jgi:hypothetical protein
VYPINAVFLFFLLNLLLILESESSYAETQGTAGWDDVEHIAGGYAKLVADDGLWCVSILIQR